MRRTTDPADGLKRGGWQMEAKKEVTLSSGYFRHEDTGHIFYYSRVWNYNIADGICIAPDAADGGVYTFSGVSLSKNSDFKFFTLTL